MEQDIEKIVQAINIASDPRQNTLHAQALEFLSSIQHNPDNAWRIGLSLFVDVNADNTRKYPSQVRFYALRILDDFLETKSTSLGEECCATLRQSFLSYIQSEYVYGNAESDSPFLRNKFSHTLTLLFLATYIDQWPNFFDDLFIHIKPAQSSSQFTFNRHVSLLFFHVVLEISGEVADQILKSARNWDRDRHVRDARVKDAVRERDAGRINEAVLTIVAEASQRLTSVRDQGSGTSQEVTGLTEIVDWGIRTFGSYVGWIDINLTVTPTTIPLLFTALSDPSLAIRLATSVALLRIVSKGLKEPADKLQLIKVLSLGQVIDALEAKTRQAQIARGDDVDEGEESYREALGKLLNTLGLELMKLIEECQEPAVVTEANQLLEQILPVLLRFTADEYDDTCSTVFPLLQVIMTNYKRIRRVTTGDLDPQKKSFLSSFLQVVLQKMKWEENTEFDDPEDEDITAFEGLRKDLRAFMDSVSAINQDLVTDAVGNLASATLSAFQSGVPVKWNDMELSVYLVYLFGEINKTGGKGRAAFCSSPIPEKGMRKDSDYSDVILNQHGELLLNLVQSGVSGYPHKTVTMQFFETVTRYGDFFKVKRDCIAPVLEAMIDSRGVYNPDSTVRSRVFYLLHRFIKENRGEIAPELASGIVDAMRNLLVIHVELPELDEPEKDLLTEAISNATAFDSQLYLFETAGILCSLLSKTPDQQAALLLSVVRPLMDDLSNNFQQYAKLPQDVVSIVKVHHIIMALGNIAKGFPEFQRTEDTKPPPLEVLTEVARALLVCLESMNKVKVIREAARFSFARILATAGSNVTYLIPMLMSSLLTHFEPTELVEFMNFIGLVVHKLQSEMFGVLDELIQPLNSHIISLLSQPVHGTDDQVTQSETKRGYVTLLNNIMAAKLSKVFTSERNMPNFETLVGSMLHVAGDHSDLTAQKAALIFLGRGIQVWGLPGNDGLPGYERFIYERIMPTAFSVASLPDLNIKDGQVVTVLHEVANLLQIIAKTRDAEAYEYLLSVYFPSQNWPHDAALSFTTKLRDLDSKGFRKYFTEFVRSSRASTQS